MSNYTAFNDRLITLPEVSSKIGKGRTWIYEQINLGKFPKQVKLGGRSSAWSEREINQWIEERLNERQSA